MGSGARRRFSLVAATCALLGIGGVPLAFPAAAAVPRAAPAVRAATVPAEPLTDTGDLASVARIVGARTSWAAGYTGKGIDVALIDTGVAPVPGLTSGNVIHGPDLSFDAAHPDVRHLDAFGHGTHMASIIAGRDRAMSPAGYAGQTQFQGIAPDSRLISLKVGASDGAVDVSQVIAAINWVTENRNKHGLNIRVLNLSYGTDGVQNYLVDPLVLAIEEAWRAGIVVVVAAGNDGTSWQNLANPAQSPMVIAVGASDPQGTEARIDDTVPDFSDRGTIRRHVDVVAPGVHLLGLRVPNSAVDQANPTAVTDGRLFRGSGTSQAAAVVSGSVALLLQRNPGLTPDAVKALLWLTSTPLTLGTVLNSGAGIIDIRGAELLAPVPSLLGGLLGLGDILLAEINRLKHLAAPGTGTGSLDAARGSARLVVDGVPLDGEQDIFGSPWDAGRWSSATRGESTWYLGWWNTGRWTGTSWERNDPTRWQAVDDDRPYWFGTPADDWVSRSWVAGGWDSRTWVDQSWTSRSWVGSRWSMNGWR